MSKPTYEELEAQVKRLISEASVMRQFIDDECYVYVKECGEYEDTSLYAPETPSTDAALAEIRAQGVEMFVQKCQGKAESAIAGDIRDNWNLLGAHASDFAQQLRKEQGK